MKVSAKIDYACRALLELTLHWPNQQPLSIEVISQRQRIPLAFLIQILIDLKRIGYVKSMRGKNGGYRLAQAPREVKLSDVVGHLQATETIPSDEHNNSILSSIWKEINQSLVKTMDQFNFEDIGNRKRGSDNTFTFQI